MSGTVFSNTAKETESTTLCTGDLASLGEVAGIALGKVLIVPERSSENLVAGEPLCISGRISLSGVRGIAYEQTFLIFGKPLEKTVWTDCICISDLSALVVLTNWAFEKRSLVCGEVLEVVRDVAVKVCLRDCALFGRVVG